MDDLTKLLENAGITEAENDYLQNVTLKYNGERRGWDVFKSRSYIGFVYVLESNEYGAEPKQEKGWDPGIGWEGIDTLEDAVSALLDN